ncbi:tetratricopeptide repeat protein [Trichloromonas sp.]|uniref:tetratricopeptide repeat protein n=1 Tax=Trichloromonas sp. TaxID=3069249 RepID=UPI003D81962A
MQTSLEKTYKTKYLLPAILLMVGAFVLYANTFGNAWTYDDFPVVVDNPDIRSLADFFVNSYPGRPLRELTYLVDHALFGLKPVGWHIQNIFWHGMNAALVFVVLCRLRVGVWAAWSASLLFLVHPIQVEVVANISHRKDSLAVCFALVAILCHMEACTSVRHRLAWALGALGAWLAALSAKQNVVVLPLVLLAYEYAFVAGSQRVLLKKRLLGIVAAPCALFGGLFWYFKKSTFHDAISGLLQSKANYFDGATLELYYRMVLKSWMVMLGKVVFPADLALEYTYSIPASWFDPWVVFAFLILGAYGFGLWLSAKRCPIVFLGLVWAGAFFIPVANLWPLSYLAADRYLYAPIIGFCILFGLFLQRVVVLTAVRTVLLFVLVVVLVLLTWQQNQVWKNPETLWTQAHMVSPDSAFALNNLGNVFLLQGDLLKSRDYYIKAIAVNPRNATAHYNLGMIFERVGLSSQAAQHYREFIRIDDAKFKDQANALLIRLEHQSRKGF